MTLHGAALGHDGSATPVNGQMLRRLVESIAEPGVVGAGDLLVSEQDTPDDTVKIAGGIAVVEADGAGLFGRYLAFNNGDDSSPQFTPTGGDERIDELIVRVTDGEPDWEIVEGTPAGSAVPPTITGDNYLHLARVTIPPTTSVIDDSMIEDMRPRAASTPPAPTVRHGDDIIDVSDLPRGILDEAVQAGPQTGITTEADLTGMTVTVDVPAGRKLKITAKGTLSASSNSIDATGNIKESTTQLGVWGQCWSMLAANDAIGQSGFAIVEPSAGVHTYKMTALRTGSGTLNVTNAHLIVEDIGAA